MITIVDYGLGNLGSIKNMFKRIGASAEVTNDLETISNAQKILLPGVGKFDAAMERINSTGLKDVLNKKALVEKIPVLGICLGMQLLTNRSEEGKHKGLGWIDAEAYRFKQDINLKVPHMGWNVVKQSTPSQLTDQLDDESRFYFVHTYYVRVKDESNSILKTHYSHEFDSAIQSDNIFGAQFHPEKSHKYGMKLLRNFAEL